MKKLLSVVLALLMLAVMLPVTAMAEDIPTLGSDKVWKNVTPANVQDVLDGRYGSIDNTTIVLTAGTYGQLELGRATKYPGSNTQYMVGGFDESAANYQKFNTAEALKTYEEENHWSPNCHYIRSMSNVTIKAAAGAEVKVAGLFASSGHIYQNSTDYVLDKAVQGGMHTYYLAQKMSNITIEGITFTAKTDINTSIPETTINGFTFKNCTFNIGSTDDNSDYIALRYYNENNNGNLTDLTVENCKFNSCRQGVYTSHIKNVTVKGCTFDTTGHNAIAIQDFKGTCDHGNVVITGNTFKNVGDRIIRFNNVGEGTTITISNNTSVNSGASNGEIIKATTLPEGMEVTMTNDNWGKVSDKDPVIGNGFIETTTGGTIVIITPTEDTPKTEPEKNPTTGANDMVAAAVALMAVSTLGMAVLSRKK
ncbi:MAG: right-handed parallel beta-helix repeat-containing protein [Angelakisella sp.]